MVRYNLSALLAPLRQRQKNFGCGYSQVNILLRQALEGIGGDAVDPQVIGHLAAHREER